MRDLLRNSLSLSVAGAIAVIGAEAMARVDDAVRAGTPVFASPSFTDLTMQDSLGTRGRPFARYEKWRLNGEGFRSPEISVDPRPGCIRVAVLGASETFGYEESPGKEYPAQLADSLNRGRCYEVINSGVVGLPITGQIQLWENWVSRFKPNVVVIYPSPVFYLSNDPPKFAVREKDTDSEKGSASYITATHFQARILGRLHNHLHYPEFIQRRRVMRTIARALDGKADDWMYTSVPNARLALFRSHLDSLVASVRARGATPVLVTHAMRFGNPIRAEDEDLLRAWRQFTPRATETVLINFERDAAVVVRDAARDAHVPLADVANVMSGRTMWFTDFVHFTDDGAGIVAGNIARTVENIGAASSPSFARRERTSSRPIASSGRSPEDSPGIMREAGRTVADRIEAAR